MESRVTDSSPNLDLGCRGKRDQRHWEESREAGLGREAAKPGNFMETETEPDGGGGEAGRRWWGEEGVVAWRRGVLVGRR